VTFATAASKAATALKELKEAQTVGDIVDTVVGKVVLKRPRLPLKQQPASTIEVQRERLQLLVLRPVAQNG
jgi:hypothetical protein